MGRVYRARDLRLNRPVALKVLAPALADQREALIRLRREAETASSLNHPALVTIFDVGEATDGQVFVAMELIGGASLRESFRQSRRIEDLLEMFSQVADGLAAAHEAGVIHRDIKPENIMIGSHGYAKVVDFGLAKSTAPAASDGDTPTVFVTEAGTIVGTVLYMAPEQLLGEPLAGACDVFSLGCVLHEALSGRAPFAARTQAETIARILHDEPAPLPADADSRLTGLVQRMLARQPAARPAMRIVAQELRGITRASGTGGNAVAVRKPRRRLAAVVIVLVAVAIITVTGLMWSPRSSPPDRPADPQVAELYANAQFFAGDPKWTVQDKAIPILEQVVRRDPKFVPARVELARQYARKAFELDPDRKWEQKAFVEADRILRLDPHSPAVHTILSQLKWTRARGFPHEEAMIEIAKALAADPSYVSARSQRASILMHVGLLDEALADYESLRRELPANVDIRMRIARIRLWQRDYAAALREFREYTPENYQVANALIGLGRDDEAEAFVRHRLGDDSAHIGNTDMAGVHALVLARKGKHADAERAIAAAIESGQASSHFHHALYNVACAYAAMGNAAKAVEALETVSRQGMPCHPLFAGDPMLDPIRGDARFRQFLADSRDAFVARRRALTPLITPRR